MCCYYSLVVAKMCAASALISIGSVLGKTNLVQLILITLLEVSGFVLNQWLLQTLLRASSLLSIYIRSAGPSVSPSYPRPVVQSALFAGNLSFDGGLSLQVRPLKSIMLLHIFGAFFGVMLTFTLYRKTSKFEKEKCDTKTGLFSMLGR